MAGGVGSRFWPLSTPSCPKQFIDILGCGRTLIQLTMERFESICPPENVWVVTNKSYVDTVAEQLPSIQPSHILAEPAARNTAPCIAWACWRIRKEDPCANVVVTPSDAAVMDPVEFRRVIRNALSFSASSDSIVTIGIKPSRPETGYGYIEQGLPSTSSLTGASAGPDASGEILHVRAFKEKPDLELARKYLDSGTFLWNAGIFVWNVKTIVSSLRTYCPSLSSAMDRMEESGDIEGVFPQCEKISIDYAVMEPASLEGRVFTHPADFGWSDLGNWASLYDKLQCDEDGNASVGNVRLFECRDCLVHAENAEMVVIQGLEGYIISEHDGRLLVCRRSEEQRIRDFSSNLMPAGKH